MICLVEQHHNCIVVCYLGLSQLHKTWMNTNWIACFFLVECDNMYYLRWLDVRVVWEILCERSHCIFHNLELSAVTLALLENTTQMCKDADAWRIILHNSLADSEPKSFCLYLYILSSACKFCISVFFVCVFFFQASYLGQLLMAICLLDYNSLRKLF